MDATTLAVVERLRELQAKHKRAISPSAVPGRIANPPRERLKIDAVVFIGELRRFRVRAEDLSIKPHIQAIQDNTARHQKRFGKLIVLWERHIPRDLADQTTLSSLSRGVLGVTVDSSSIMYELDRVLRGGAFAAIQRGFPATLSEYRLKFGERLPRIRTG